MRFVSVEVPKTSKPLYDPELGERIVNKARQLAEKRNIPFPRRVGMSGCWGEKIYLPYRTNAVRDLLIEAAKIKRIKVLKVVK